MDTKALQEIKEKMQTAEREANRLEGKMEQLETYLQTLQCSDVAEAEKKLKKMQREFEERKRKFDEKLDTFKRRYNVS